MKTVTLPYLSWYISRSGLTVSAVSERASGTIQPAVMRGQQGVNKDLAFRLAGVLRCGVEQLERGPQPDLVVNGLPVAWCSDNGCQLVVYRCPLCGLAHRHSDRELGRQFSNCTAAPGPQPYFLKLLSTATERIQPPRSVLGNQAMHDWMERQEDGEVTAR